VSVIHLTTGDEVITRRNDGGGPCRFWTKLSLHPTYSFADVGAENWGKCSLEVKRQ